MVVPMPADQPVRPMESQAGTRARVRGQKPPRYQMRQPRRISARYGEPAGTERVTSSIGGGNRASGSGQHGWARGKDRRQHR